MIVVLLGSYTSDCMYIMIAVIYAGLGAAADNNDDD